MIHPKEVGAPSSVADTPHRREWRVGAGTLAVLVLLFVGGSLIHATSTLGGAFPAANGKIAYTSYQGGNNDVYTRNSDGSGQTRLTSDTNIDTDPAISADGSKIVYATKQGGGAFEIYSMSTDGSGKTNLSNHTNSDFDPTWSPDGTKVAFTSERSGSIDVWVMNADGTGAANLTGGVAEEDREPSWSPDGSKIAFASKRSGNFDVWVMNADGTSPMNLTGSASAEDQWPTWSPDGTKVAFGSKRSGNFDVWVMNADGSAPVNLTSNSAVEDQEPAWSPDGTKIAFASKRAGNFDVWVMNPDGSAPVNHTSANSQEDHTPDWGGLPAAPAFSSTSPTSPANHNDPAIAGSAPAGSTVRLYTDAACTSAVAAAGSAAQFAAPGLTVAVADDSIMTFYATATNAGGTSPCSQSSITFAEDSTPPSTSITEGPSGISGDSTPSFSFGSSEPGSTFECRVDGGSWVACESPHTLGPLGDGSHTFEVRAVDAAGNADQTPASVTVTVDTVVPSPKPGGPEASGPPSGGGAQPGGSPPGGQPPRRLAPGLEDLGAMPGNLAAAERCQRLSRPVRSRSVLVPRAGTVHVGMRANAVVTPTQPVLVTVRGPATLRTVRYLLNGRALRGAARAPFKLALAPAALSSTSRNVLTIRLAPRRGEAKQFKLRLHTAPCRTVFVAAQRRTGNGSRLRLRVDSVRALRRITFKLPSGLLPRSAADRPAGKLTVRTAGGGRKSFRLSLQGRDGRLALNTSGAPRVLMRRGQIDITRLPARTGIVGLELTGRLPLTGKGRRVKLRARVVGAEGSEALTRELRGSGRR